MNAVVKLSKRPGRLIAEAKSALKHADGVMIVAADMLRKSLESDPELFAEALEPYVDKAVWKILNQAKRRLKALESYRKPTREDRETNGLQRVAQSNMQDYLDGYRLANGTVLGDARRTDLILEASFRRQMIRSQEVHLHFVIRLAESMKDGAIVREQFTNKRLQAVMDEVKKLEPNR